MDLFVDDDGFVRAPAPLVYRCLTHIGAWNDWWPGVVVSAAEVPTPADGVDREDAEAWRMIWRDRLLRLRMTAFAHGWRHDAGFHLALSGDVTGRAEFWLEPGHGGTVVHHVLVGETGRRRPLRILRGYRRVLRRGLWELKDRLQAQVREELGLQP